VPNHDVSKVVNNDRAAGNEVSLGVFDDLARIYVIHRRSLALGSGQALVLDAVRLIGGQVFEIKVYKGLRR
jgi:hypothetical protein